MIALVVFSFFPSHPPRPVKLLLRLADHLLAVEEFELVVLVAGSVLDERASRNGEVGGSGELLSDNETREVAEGGRGLLPFNGGVEAVGVGAESGRRGHIGRVKEKGK